MTFRVGSNVARPTVNVKVTILLLKSTRPCQPVISRVMGHFSVDRSNLATMARNAATVLGAVVSWLTRHPHWYQVDRHHEVLMSGLFLLRMELGGC